MPTVFAACDFMIHAATGEGFPLAVQEAMASGLPVVLRWDSGYAAAVDRGAVVAVESLDELSTAAARLASDPAGRSALGARARAFVLTTWSWDLAVRRHLEIFHSSVDDLRASTT
jgi:glycosyltransferase involved in cell wall biosynthesis